MSRSEMNETAVRLLMAPGVDLADLEDFAAPRPAWQAQGACRAVDTAVFFIERGGDPTTAREVCAGCSVLSACRDYAMADRSLMGTWGGTSHRERMRMRGEVADAA